MLALWLTLAAAAPGDTAAPAAAQSAPAVTVHRQPTLPVVALRLSLLADDPPGLAGAGHLIQHLHLGAMEEQAARVGGRVQALRTSDALVYTVTGPATELDFLAGVLRAALRAPRAEGSQLLVALNTLGEERAAERERAPSYVRASLRSRIFPGDLPAAGTAASARRLESASLEAAWDRMYSPDRISVVAVGNVGVADVSRALRGLPAGSGAAPGEALPDSVAPLAADTPQATQHWLGWAAPAGGDDPAALSVAARILQGRLRRAMPNSAVEVEHWWTHHGHALAIVVATPGARAATARRTLGGALAAALAAVDEETVRTAAAGVRRDLLFYARTPERMAEVLGAFADRGDDPEAASGFFAALDGVTEAAVRRVLEDVAAREGFRVEVAPQKLVPN
jgi:predicted Zn-dependent peptidase